jgi:hypothetical protein
MQVPREFPECPTTFETNYCTLLSTGSGGSTLYPSTDRRLCTFSVNRSADFRSLTITRTGLYAGDGWGHYDNWDSPANREGLQRIECTGTPPWPSTVTSTTATSTTTTTLPPVGKLTGEQFAEMRTSNVDTQQCMSCVDAGYVYCKQSRFASYELNWCNVPGYTEDGTEFFGARSVVTNNGCGLSNDPLMHALDCTFQSKRSELYVTLIVVIPCLVAGCWIWFRQIKQQGRMTQQNGGYGPGMTTALGGAVGPAGYPGGPPVGYPAAQPAYGI